MFYRRRAQKSRREYERQAAADALFMRRRLRDSDVDDQERPPREGHFGEAPPANGQQLFCLERVDELRLPRLDVPALTVTADPSHGVSVAGGERDDWSLRFRAQARGRSDDEAKQRLLELSMVRYGGTVSLVAPDQMLERSAEAGRGHLVVRAPLDASVVVHASYAAVELYDLRGAVHVATPHGRATVLNTTGRVDATALAIDFSGSGGPVVLSAQAEINIKVPTPRFEGTLVAWAQRSVKVLVPPGFATSFVATVARRGDFICRTDFASRVSYKKSGDMHHFSYDAPNASSDTRMRLHSEQSTVVVDTLTARSGS